MSRKMHEGILRSTPGRISEWITAATHGIIPAIVTENNNARISVFQETFQRKFPIPNKTSEGVRGETPVWIPNKMNERISERIFQRMFILE